MDEDQGRGGEAVSGAEEDRTPEQVRAEIAQTREELGDTIEAVIAKADVKAQARQAVSDARANVGATAADVRQSVIDKKDEVTAHAQQSTPDSVGETGQRALALARENRPVLIAAATFGVGLLIGSRRGR